MKCISVLSHGHANICSSVSFFLCFNEFICKNTIIIYVPIVINWYLLYLTFDNKTMRSCLCSWWLIKSNTQETYYYYIIIIVYKTNIRSSDSNFRTHLVVININHYQDNIKESFIIYYNNNILSDPYWLGPKHDEKIYLRITEV